VAVAQNIPEIELQVATARQLPTGKCSVKYVNIFIQYILVSGGTACYIEPLE
jgi:hypothetical protein